MADRSVKDAKLIVTKVFPAAAANDNTGTIDLQVAGYKGEGYALNIAWPSLPNLVDGKTIIFDVQDSADDITYTTIQVGYTITGITGNGHAAGSINLRLPATTRRYIQVNRAVLTGGGSNVAAVNTVALVF
jgi:hypothetical protein